MTTIPASQLVNVIPSVISAGGSAKNIIGLILTNSTRVPIGTVASFPTAAAVASYFGATSNEAAAAAVYFAGFVGSTALPGAVLFAQYNTAPVSAYLRGGSVGGLTLAQLQAVNALLSVTIDGVLKSATINLAAATSFSNAAEIIAFDLGIEGVQAAVVTGSISSAGGGTLTVTAVTSGTLAAGDVIAGTGVTANTYIVSQLTSTETGGTLGLRGTYQVSISQTTASTTITAFTPAVQFDSVANAFVILSGTTGVTSTITFASGPAATSLFLTAATGAVLSPGAAPATVAAFMNALIVQTTNWATFMTLFDPDGGSGNAQKQAFASWKNGQDQQFAYVAWDPDVTPINGTPAPTSLGALLAAANDTGTCLISEAAEIGSYLAAFICGAAASINFTQQNGRITFAYKSQAGLAANVTTAVAASNLIANGYNFYGAYAQASASFVFFQNGSCTGPFKWFDSFINQIWLNSAFVNALLNLLANALSIPYTDAGNNAIATALQPSIQAGLSFGAFQPGTISAAQINAVNAMAGTRISDTLQAQGWYLQILPATAAVRAARGSPPCTFWYLDRGSVQQINLASVEVQ